VLVGHLLRLRHRQRIGLARFRAVHTDEFKTIRELDSAYHAGSGKRIEERILALEIKAEVLEAVIGGYDDIVKAASREMSRRDSERAPRD
jgi:hypothetical protein